MANIKMSQGAIDTMNQAIVKGANTWKSGLTSIQTKVNKTASHFTGLSGDAVRDLFTKFSKACSDDIDWFSDALQKTSQRGHDDLSNADQTWANKIASVTIK